jgi:hypothetical protein
LASDEAVLPGFDRSSPTKVGNMDQMTARTTTIDA